MLNKLTNCQIGFIKCFYEMTEHANANAEAIHWSLNHTPIDLIGEPRNVVTNWNNHFYGYTKIENFTSALIEYSKDAHTLTAYDSLYWHYHNLTLNNLQGALINDTYDIMMLCTYLDDKVHSIMESYDYDDYFIDNDVNYYYYNHIYEAMIEMLNGIIEINDSLKRIQEFE